MALLRHGGMNKLFTGAYAPSTLGSFLRTFTFGHVRQLGAVARRWLANVTAVAPITGGIDEYALVDIDDTIKEVHGYQKQGSGYGYSGVRGLNALIGVVSTPTAAPIIVASRLRKGAVNSVRGAGKFVAYVLAAVKKAIASIGDDDWTTIQYIDAIFDEGSGKWIFSAEVAEVAFTAFSSRKTADQIGGRWSCGASQS